MTGAPTPRSASGEDRRVTLIVFPGGFNWPVWVALERGFFDRHGVEVDVVLTPGSVFQWTALAQGDARIAITLMDNVVAYREGQGADGVVVEDAIAVMGLDTRSMPALITQPGIGTYADLDGRKLAVDALRTGNALVLKGMLERGGVRLEDCRLEQAGGVMQRFEAMKRGAYAGSLFNAPLDEALRTLGFNVLDVATSLISRFQGHVVAVRGDWAQANRRAVVGFIRAILDALAFLYEPRHRADAFAIYTHNMPGATSDDAATAYSVLFHADTGFPSNGELDVAGIAEVLALRARYGEPRKALRDASAYFDSTFLGEAVARG